MKPIKPRTPGEDWLDAQRQAALPPHLNRAERRRVLSFDRRHGTLAGHTSLSPRDLVEEQAVAAARMEAVATDLTKRGVAPEIWAQMQALRQANPAAFEAARAVFIDTKAAELAALVDEGQRDLALRIVRRQLSGILGDGTVVDVTVEIPVVYDGDIVDDGSTP